ncbi:MAG: hypothetical protein Kow00104_05950 [Rhodothalassiaceae bacterium]
MPTILRALLLIGSIAAQIPPAAAQDMLDLFAYRGVKVDRSASSANVARRLALEDAQRIAFEGLIAKLASEDSAARLPPPDPALLQGLVRSVDIREEKSSATRYIATLDVAFNPEAVRNLFRTHGVLYTESGAGRWLLLPLLESEGRTVLLGPHDWRLAVEKAARGNRLIAPVLPGDDLRARSRLDATAVSYADSAALAALAGDFDAAKTVRLSVRLGLDRLSGREQADWRLDIAPLAPAETRLFRAEEGSLLAEAGESRAALLARLAERLLRRLDEAWKSRMLVAADTLTERHFTVTTETLGQWIALRRRLESVALVRAVEIERIGLPTSALSVQTLGDEEQFDLSLASARLKRNGDRLALADR